ncbi:unnamed protein product [Allacma fusca]|uniref:Uncharacterized protein n=1 Tax=Allacma fusca TaxID=39272 RepID=A0A8J2L036_9HEXA|nr:unnamed protein product [Allacma fusca]
MFKLAEVFCSLKQKPAPLRDKWEGIKNGILTLPDHYKSQFWVTRAILEYLKICLEIKVIWVLLQEKLALL